MAESYIDTLANIDRLLHIGSVTCDVIQSNVAILPPGNSLDGTHEAIRSGNPADISSITGREMHVLVRLALLESCVEARVRNRLDQEEHAEPL